METATNWIGGVLVALNPGYLTLSLIRPALDLFRSETVAPNLSALMVLAAAALMVLWWRQRVRPACAALDERIAFLRQCDSPSSFYDKIDQFDALMVRAGFLAHGWSEFIETCLFTRRDGKVNVEISIRPGVFINIDDAEHSGLNVRWFQQMSGIFVGLGLLLTFIGLVAALYFSSSAINLVIDGTRGLSAPDQTKAIQKALAQLLNTATFKFLTSIAGLGCSLVLGTFERKWMAVLEQKFQDLSRELERCTIAVTPEQLANRQHRELSSQTDLLQELPGRLGPEFARALEAAVANALPAVLDAALAPVLGKLDETALAIVNARQEPLHAMVQEFNATITATAGREFRAVAETLSSLPTRLSSAAETLAIIPAQMSGASGDLQRTLAALTHGMEAFQARVVPPVDDQPMKALAAEITGAIDGLRAALAEQAAHREPARDAETVAAFTELSYALSRMEAVLHGNTTAVAALLDSLAANATETSRTLAAETARSVAAMTAATQHLGATLDDALRQLHDRSTRSAGDIAERFLDAARAAQETAAEQAARIEDAITKIAAAGVRAGESVSEAATQASGTLDQRARDAAAEVVGGSQQVLSQFATTVDRLWLHIDTLNRALASVENRIGAHAAALEGVNRSARETESAFTGAARAVGTASAPLTRIGEAMAQSMDTLAHTMGTTVDGLKESQHQGQTLASDLRETLHRLQTVWSQHESRFIGVDDSLSRVLTAIIEHVDAHGAALRDHVVKIDTHLAQTVNNLAGNVEALQETASELNRAVTGIRKIVEALPAPVPASPPHPLD